MKRAAIVALLVLFGVVVGLLFSPVILGKGESKQIESAFVKGAMVKISASKLKCQQWELRNRRAICDE